MFTANNTSIEKTQAHPFTTPPIIGTNANSDTNTHTKFIIKTNNPQEVENRAVAGLIKILG